MKHVLLAVTEALEAQKANIEVQVIDLKKRIRFLRSIEADEQTIEALEQVLMDSEHQLHEHARCAHAARTHISSS